MPLEAKYVDLQVNGYAGVDFNNDDLTADALHAACRRLRDDGVAGILATVVTDTVERMSARLARIAKLRREDPLAADVIWGVHVEGPFINPDQGYAGAHPADRVRPAEIDVMGQLLDRSDGLTRLVTLAPECDAGLRVTKFLVKQGIVVAAGHCNSSLEQLCAAIDAGLSMFTHLGNGCPMMLNRHDNIIHRVLSLHERLMISFIADGVHVPHPALANYLRLAGVERSIVVTDAISAAGMPPGRYTLRDRVVQVGDDLVAKEPDGSHLIGSTATMPRMIAWLSSVVGLSEGDIDRLVVDNPLAVLGKR